MAETSDLDTASVNALAVFAHLKPVLRFAQVPIPSGTKWDGRY